MSLTIDVDALLSKSKISSSIVRPELRPDSKLMLVGEAPGKDEDLLGMPFMGYAGQELNRILRDAGLRREDCSLTNLWERRPADNNLAHYCVPKNEWAARSAMQRFCVPRKNLGKDLWFDPWWLAPALERLQREIISVRPNLILALGNTALWALTGSVGITKLRGTILTGDLVPGIKILPTYHPSAVLRAWETRPIVVMDFIKAAREMQFPQVRRLPRMIWLEPTLEDLTTFQRQHIDPLANTGAPLSVDVETPANRLACIGLATSERAAIVLPLVDRRKPGCNYWPSLQDELRAIAWLRGILQDARIKKVMQNGLFDVQRLFVELRIRVLGFSEDTMLAHHALYSELQKGLDFLGSVYTDEIAWKLLRPRGETTEMKRDE